MLIKSPFNRRSLLRGALNGAAVTVALPLLDCFLDINGEAMAATGSPVPIRFGTWFWGLGMDSEIFVPKKIGSDYDLPEELSALKDVKQHINLFTNFRVLTDGRPNLCHYTGWVGLRTGGAPSGRGDLPGQSLDMDISDAISGGTRFRSIQLAATGNPLHSYSFRSSDAINPPEISAIEFYQMIFGSEFRDPNTPNFVPDPLIATRKSVLSAVMDDSAALKKTLGAEDNARLEQYFTSIRELEGRLALQLEKPAPADACIVPRRIDKDIPVGTDVELVQARHRAMTDILVLALACNQTKIFNMLYSDSGSTLTRVGFDKTHHTLTHEELIDDKLGYQKESSWFIRRAMDEWAYFVAALARVKEGPGTLLDRTLVYAHSDQEFAKIHSLDGIPMMTAGRAGGAIKTGMHISGSGDPGTRVGLTVKRAMGIAANEWGMRSMATSKDISEVLA